MRAWWVLAFALIPLAQPAAAAEPAAAASGAAVAKTDSAAIAQDLFDQGLELMKQEKYAEACAKLEGSNRAAWAPGTTINLADCYEKIGRLASAWAKFLESEPHFRNRTPPDPRADVAKERAEKLYPKLARLTVEVAPEAKVPGLTITRDGDAIDEAQWGSGVPVDPGKHVVEASAPGKKTWKWEGEAVAGGAPVPVKVPVLEDASPGSGSAGGDAEAAMPVQRKIAIAAGAVGVAGLVVGGVFGGLTLGKVDDANKTCTKLPDGVFACDDAGVKAREDAKGLSTVSTIGLIAGGVLVAGGAVLWLTAPGAAPAKGKDAARRVWIAPAVSAGYGGISAGGNF